MKHFLAALAYFFGFFAAILSLEAVFAAWWDIDANESMLPLMAAGAVAIAASLLLRGRASFLRRPDNKWMWEHIVEASAIFGAAFFLFVLIWGVIVGEGWRENLAWSAGGAVAIFGALVVLGYVERFIREREARTRGIAVDDYKPGRLAQRIMWTLAVAVGLYLLLGLVVELSMLGDE